MSVLDYTQMDEIPVIYEKVRATFRQGTTKSIAFRKQQLAQLAHMCNDNRKEIEDAFAKDLGRPPVETSMCDTNCVINEATYAYKNVEKWVKPRRAPFNQDMFMFSPNIWDEPKGTVLIISPFNYPLWTSGGPLAGAIAAGCTAVIKLPELTPNITRLLTKLFAKYLDNTAYAVVNGAVEETTKLLSFKWDHILYTGSGRVGRVVAEAAARNLTPTTLELGGKSPVFVDPDADLYMAAKRILWGKQVNAGQTCLTPDYVLIPEGHQDRLVQAFKKVYHEFYPDGTHAPGVLGRVPTVQHWDRINGLLQNTRGEIILGGEAIRDDRYFGMTIIRDVTYEDSLMQEEIFGALLPIIPYKDIDVCLKFINEGNIPLALHVFTQNKKYSEMIRTNTRSGMFLVNDILYHAASVVTPFGGLGDSGYGSHKGYYSFKTFTHERTELSSPGWLDILLRGARYPPYTVEKKAYLDWVFKKSLPPRPEEEGKGIFGFLRSVMSKLFG